MAGPIIDQSGERANLILQTGEARARATEAVGFTIAHAIDQYSQNLEREKDHQLSIMSVIASKYGFNKMGPDFTRTFENLSGVKFPRDDKGQIVIPQTDEEAIMAKMKPVVDEALNSPQGREIALGYMGLTAKPKPQSEMDLQKAKLAEVTAYHDKLTGIDALKAQAAIVKAERGGSVNAKEGDQPSGFMTDPSDKKGLAVIPWDGQGQQITQREFKNRAGQSKLVEQQERQAKIEHMKEQLAKDTADNKLFASMLKVATDPKLRNSPEQQMAKKYVATHSRVKLGVDMDSQENDKSWWQTLKDAVLPSIGTETPDERVSKRAASPARADTSDPTASMSDDDLSKLIAQRVQQGMTGKDIFEQSGNSMRVLKTLNDLGVTE